MCTIETVAGISRLLGVGYNFLWMSLDGRQQDRVLYKREANWGLGRWISGLEHSLYNHEDPAQPST